MDRADIGESDPNIGSSPRLRGTGPRPLRRPSWIRFIPVPAGNSGLLPEDPCVDSVHPRACGEQTQAPGAIKETTGSSPRLRGTGVVARPHDLMSRFIPAPAGNRAASSARSPPATTSTAGSGSTWRPPGSKPTPRSPLCSGRPWETGGYFPTAPCRPMTCAACSSGG